MISRMLLTLSSPSRKTRLRDPIIQLEIGIICRGPHFSDDGRVLPQKFCIFVAKSHINLCGKLENVACLLHVGAVIFPLAWERYEVM